MDDGTIHTCPYCGRILARPTEVDPATTTVADRLRRPDYVETRPRDINIGLALGLVVVLFMDIGVLVRRDFTPLGFGANVVVAAALTILLGLWYRQMRVDTAAANTERHATYEKRLETWRHTYYCRPCDAVFVRE